MVVKNIWALPLLAVALPSLAQVDVVVSEPESVSAPQNPVVESVEAPVEGASVNQQAELFYQLQTLQQDNEQHKILQQDNKT